MILPSEKQETKGVSSKIVSASLKGVKKAQARTFYRALEQHFFADDCLGCNSYLKYATLLVKGQFYQHLETFMPDINLDVVELVEHLKDSRMISVQNNEEMYRVTFMHLQAKEGHNDGDSNI
jgi:hypothetical protein